MSWGRVVRRNTYNFFGGVEQEEVFETGGIIFGDGRCIELIKNEHGGLSLLDSNQNANESIEATEFGGRTCVPPSLHPSIREALILPMERVPCGSTGDLFRQIHDLFVDHGVSDKDAKLSAYFSIATWFLEVIPIAPCLVLTGPRPEANMVLQLLSSVVRRALPLGDVDPSGFRSLPMHVRPTLLIGHLHPSINRMLSASSYPETFLPCRNGLIDLYCAKVVYAGAGVADGFHADAVLKIDLGPSRGKLPLIDPGTRQTIAAKLQPRLLDYRFKYVVNVRDSGFDVPTLPSSLRILARALGACVVDAPDIQAGIVPLLEAQQELARANRWVDPLSVALEVLLERCHGDPAASRVGIGEIAETATAMLADRGQQTKVEAKLIGSILRACGLSPRRDSQGYNVVLTDDARRLIHRLVRDREVEAPGQARASCSHCAETTEAQGDSEIGTI